MPEMPQTPAGVFLSYARDDTEAASRIAEALRAAGVETWFDQSELRGGDAWDQHIRRQIRECALFVLIISANTQARAEGYFRREWRLAVDRTQDMASHKAFLVPVVIDDTRESDALVPDEVMRVQWTRLKEGQPTAAFVANVQRLLDPTRRPGLAARPAGAPVSSGPVQKKSNLPVVIAVVAVALGACVAGVIALSRKPGTAPAVPLLAAPNATAPLVAPRADDKSVAVLPFENISADQDNAFFAEGIHEDILTNLAHVRQLRVVSRTSVMQYKGTTKPIKQIAAELGVAYILEGSVQRQGNKVRVTGQLIKAATDEHIWAESYDQDLTDIFAIQSKLAQAIAEALQTAVSPEDKAVIARWPTANTAAYELFLRARALANNDNPSVARCLKQVVLLKQAVDLDPNYAQAWGELADVYAFGSFLGQAEDPESLAKAKAAIDRAVALDPENPDVITSLGTYYYYAFRDYGRATREYERLAQTRPNDPTLFYSLGLIQRRQGQWAQSTVNLRKAVALDPGNLGYLRNLSTSLQDLNLYPEAEEIQKRVIALTPGDNGELFTLAAIQFSENGSRKPIDDLYASLGPASASDPMILNLRFNLALIFNDLPEAIRLDHLQPYYKDSALTPPQQAIVAAEVYYLHGDLKAAMERMGDAGEVVRKQSEADPKNPVNFMFLALVEVFRGNGAEARRLADHSVALLPEARDALDAPQLERSQASVYDMTGDKAGALRLYARLLRTPGGSNVWNLKYGWSSLHGDPRYEALIADPANNAPLI